MRLKHFLSVFLTLLTLSVGQMWGAITNNNNGTYTEPSGTGSFSNNTITWSFAAGNITVVQSATGGNNPGSSYTEAARIYRYNTLSCTASNGFKIEKVEIVCSGTKYGANIGAGSSMNGNSVTGTSDVTSDVTYSSGHTHSFTPTTAGAKTQMYIKNANSGTDNVQIQWASGGLKVTYSYTAPTAVAAGTITSSDFGLSITDALNTNKYDVYFNTSGTAPTATTTPSETNKTTKTPTISSGVSEGTTYYVWARSVKTISSNTWKSAWTALTGGSLTTESAASCTNEITITKGTPEHGTFELTGAGTICIDAGNASVTLSDIEAASGYRFKEITSSGGGTINNNAKTVTNISANTTINVVFEQIPSHKAFFYNGTTLLNAGGTDVQEGAAVSYSGATPTSCESGTDASTTFAGWATDTWEGKVAKNDIEPDFYESTLPVMGDKDVTYYAVFCKAGTSATPTSVEGEISTSNPYLSGTGWATSTAKTYSGPYLRLDADEQNITYTAPSNTTISRFQFKYKLMASTACSGHNNNQWWTGEIGFYGSNDGGTVWTKIDAKSISYDASCTSASDVAKDYADLSSGGYNAIKIQLNKTCGNVGIKDLSATYSATASPASNYMTTCCTSLGSINGSVSWNNDGTSLTVKNWGYTQGTGAAESNISKYTVYLYSDADSYAASIDNADCTVDNRASTGVTFDDLDYARTYKVKITVTPASGYCPVDDVWSSDTYKLTCATPTAATAGSFARATQKMPISWTSGAGKVDICYSSNSSTPATTPGSGYTVVSNQTSSPVNLDVSGLAAGNYYCWVRSVCDASNKSNWTAITGNTFTIPTHTLTITKDGGGSSTITPASGTAVVEGRTASVEASPATGYKFVNWAVSGTNAELSSTTDNPTTFTMGTADATVTGTFGLISYKVRFNKNNDDATGSMDDQTFTYGESKELSANAFELTNYTFSGWATTQEGAVAHEDEAEVENLSTADGAIVNLYAVWTANSHSVTYVANDKTDGTVPTDANSPYNHNAQVTVLGGGTLEKEHYAFVGWTDGVTNYVAGNKFTITDDVTLSARWTCDEKVTVSEGTPTNGSFTLDNSGVLATCDAAVVVTVSPSANPGYEFDAITVNGVGTKDDNAKKVTYAQNTSGTSEINVTFKAKSLSVTWNLNYEGAPDPSVDTYTYDGSSLTLPEPVREGYTFDGWFTATEDGDEIDNVGGSNKPSANVEYFAHWSPISCDVVWKVKGEAWTPYTTKGEGQNGSTTANYDAKVSQLPTPPTNADGCGDRFMGWTATENYKGNSAPADLFNDVEHAPLIKTNPTTYYAVFADYVE